MFAKVLKMWKSQAEESVSQGSIRRKTTVQQALAGFEDERKPEAKGCRQLREDGKAGRQILPITPWRNEL